VTCVSYTARDFGVGEVWFEDERLVWHELRCEGCAAGHADKHADKEHRIQAGEPLALSYDEGTTDGGPLTPVGKSAAGERADAPSTE